MPAPIQSNDSGMDRFSKMLPADVTAAFISTKSALLTAFSAGSQAYPVVISFLLILFVCPFYFHYVSKITNRWHRWFLVATSAVFAFALADKEIATFLIDVFAAAHVDSTPVNPTVKVITTVLPILWTLLVSQVALGKISDKAVDTGIAR